MKKISILGSTGSIGVAALDIISRNPELFKVVALAAGTNINRLAAQVEKFRPKMVSVADASTARKLKDLVGRKTKIMAGAEGAMECAAHPDANLTLSAMVGAAGLPPTLAAVYAGKNVALANKETLVAAGGLVMREARKRKVKIIPVDSEHSAIFQCLRGEKMKTVRRLILTSSGGPFLRAAIADMEKVTPEQALKHPNWNMGPKITVDSATMMNKGLEVIEARWLFNLPPEKIDVVAHPQSVIHSMVEFHDSSVMAQMGLPDMRTPISFALGYPERTKLDLTSLDLATMGTLTFEKPDLARFPALALAYEAMRIGGSAPAALNAANEVAVEAFLNGRIGFLDIARLVEKTLNEHKPAPIKTLADALLTDQWARARAREFASNGASRQ
ncbi:MAG: 1-deoxy-D-xylulose-5-phosphate reductoisomerase [Nitrospinae bacterium]|nr:1-deoxy-D-xylulose-5-phosphate reductoisomerase [Nitrospinota bacterium]